MAIKIVDLPLKIVIFHSYVSLPEGIIQQWIFGEDIIVIQWE